MTFAVIAEFLLGTYRGHAGEGPVDQVPSPARVHAALLNAAASGPRAVEVEDGLAPCAEDAAVLAWLEENPPTGLALPKRQVNTESITVFRDGGLLKSSRDSMTVKRPAKPLTGCVVWAGAMGWTWEEPPPEAIRTALGCLCRDVAYLGMAESPVRLTIGEVTATHRIERRASGWEGNGVVLRTPMVGRVAELQAAHRSRIGSVPSLRADAAGSDEGTVRAPSPAARVTHLRYLPCHPGSDMRWPPPWETVLCVPLDQGVDEDLRVRAAVSVHGALIKHLDGLGLDVPPCVTGSYPRGQSRPSNGVAIQFLDESWSPYHRGPDDVPLVAVLVPTGHTGVADLVQQALRTLRRVSVPRRAGLRVTGPPMRVPAGEFWAPPAPGTLRWWQTEPAAVPELRPLRRNWSGQDTVAASTALLWRDRFQAPGRGDQRYRALADGAVEHGVRVRSVERVPGDASRFVHKVPQHMVVHPYRAQLHLGDLAGASTMLALGQSRHLGCGLLVPFDELPDDTGDTIRS